MKKIATHLFALAMLVCSVMITSAVVNAAPVTPTSGTGAREDPFVISLADYGDYEHASTASSDTAYYSVTFAKDGIVTFKGGSIYEGSSSTGVGANTPVTANTPMDIRNAGSRSLSISFNAASSYTTKETAYDLSAVTTAQAVSIPQGAQGEKNTWFKFKITEPSTIEFEPYVTTAYYGFLKADGTTSALSAKNFYDPDDFSKITSNGTISFTALDQNIFIPTNTYKTSYSTDHAIEDGKAKLSFYEAGTYYIYASASSSADRGFKSFVVRKYNPITSVTFSKGTSINIVEGREGTNVTNYITGLVPENADGFPNHIEYDTTKLQVTATTIGGSDKLSGVDLKGAFGNATVTVKDERGESVGSYTINNTPKTVVDLGGVGTWNSATVHIASGNSQSSADSIRIYIKNGSSYKLYKTYTFKGNITCDSKMVIKKLKANKKYSIKLTNYDSKSGAESAMSKEFVIGTAPNKKPKIKSVKNIKIKKQTGTLIHNSGKINEYRTHYTYYAASGKITVGKIKGASLYEFNLYGTSCPNSSSKASGVYRLVKGGNTAASCKKTLKLQCRISKKINNDFTAYGPWSKVKKVKIR